MTANRTLTIFAAVLVFLAPAGMLTYQGGTGYCFFLLLALSVGYLVATRADRRFLTPLGMYPLYTASMVVFAVVLPLQQIIGHYYLPRQFDAMSRFILSLPIFLILCVVPVKRTAVLGWGCAAGALGASVWAFVSGTQASWSDLHRLGNPFTNPIPFGNFSLLLGFIAVLSIRWDTGRYRMAGALVKWLSLLAGGYASYLSGTRGGWLALPFLAAIVAANFGWLKHPVRALVIVIVLAVCGGTLMSTSMVHQRLHDTKSDFMKLDKGDTDTSIGARLQLWRASSRLFAQHPVFGVGKGHLEASLQTLAKNGEAPQAIVNERAHSEFFSTIAELGIIGVAALALVYIGPFVYFARYVRSPRADVATAAYCGLAVSSSVITFGLTIDVFSSVMNVALVALLWAAMMAIIYRGTCVEVACGREAATENTPASVDGT